MVEALAKLIADGGTLQCQCAHACKVGIITSKEGGKLVSCPVLAKFFYSNRQERQGCSVLESGRTCPYEAHGKMIAKKTSW